MSYITKKKIENFIYFKTETIDGVQLYIKDCNEKGHFQQVSYSVHGDCLTMICFNCERVVSNYKG